jgi:hypothetical protein
LAEAIEGNGIEVVLPSNVRIRVRLTRVDARASTPQKKRAPSLKLAHASPSMYPRSAPMNIWKPVALCAIAAVVALLGSQTASAGNGVCHDQPNMAAALSSLRAARASLEKAEHNKGGWRAKAIENTDIAIRETDRGCAFADGK